MEIKSPFSSRRENCGSPTSSPPTPPSPLPVSTGPDHQRYSFSASPSPSPPFSPPSSRSSPRNSPHFFADLTEYAPLLRNNSLPVATATFSLDRVVDKLAAERSFFDDCLRWLFLRCCCCSRSPLFI
ncbi:uncharacterized protein LOC116249729 [Nymphaea colorata]|nr:uncharacterized protein LOC116249729 [Nymphaea colorata]